MKNKTILFVVPRYHTNMVTMTEAFIQHGCHVEVLVDHIGTIEDHSVLTPIVKEKNTLRANEAEAFIEKISPALVVIRSTDLNARLISRQAKKKKIACLYYDQDPFYVKCSLYCQICGFVAVIKRFLKGLPVRRITPVKGKESHCVDFFTHHFSFPMRPGDLVQKNKKKGLNILCVGKLDQKRKRQDWVLKHFESQAFRDINKITFTGAFSDTSENSAHYQELTILINNSKYKEKIQLLKNFPFRRMAELYRSHDILILPSIREPFGISPLEAMSFGCIPVVADDNGFSYYLNNSYNGVVFDANSFDDFSRKVMSLTESKDDIERISKNAYLTVVENHKLNSFVHDIFSISCL